MNRYMMAKCIKEGKPLNVICGEALMTMHNDMDLLREVNPMLYIPEEDERIITYLAGDLRTHYYAITDEEIDDIIAEEESKHGKNDVNQKNQSTSA